jgi:phosphate transport system substrate-binding protein
VAELGDALVAAKEGGGMMREKRWAVVGLALALSGCGSAGNPSSTSPTASTASATGGVRLTLTGSSTIAPLASELAKRFESQHPGARIDVQSGGSGRGVTDTRQGLSDIGMVSRALKEDEQDLQHFTIARDGVCVILNAANPIKALTDPQVVQIYTGKVTNWKAVGGQDAPVVVVNKAEGRSTLELFLHYFKLDNKDVKAQVIIGENEQGIKTVAGNPNAIGYVSIGTAEYEAKQGTSIKLLPMKGVEPSTRTVADATFPLARPLNLVTKGTPQGAAREFIDFAQSTAVRDLVEKQYFVPVSGSAQE